MSRSLGLREDQREVEVLVTLIFASLPLEPRWCYREQARSHRGSLLSHKLSEQQKTIWERACSR
jgi:hypothetical protein